jgi:RHS repeat-associated protein
VALPQIRPIVPGIERKYSSAPVHDTSKSSNNLPLGQTSRVIFGHNISVNVTTGALTVNTTDIAIPYHSMMLGVTRTYDAQEQYMQIYHLETNPNTDPRTHLFGSWSFQNEPYIDDAWHSTFGEYMVSSPTGSTTYYSNQPHFRIHINSYNEALRLLQSYGIHHQLLDNVEWQFSISDCILSAKHREFSLLTGSFEASTLVDETKTRLWQFFPQTSIGEKISCEYHYHNYIDSDGLRESNPSLFITIIADGLGHTMHFKPVERNPPYRSYYLSDGAGRKLEFKLEHSFSFLDGNLPGARVKTYLVTKIIDHTTSTSSTNYNYNYTNDKLNSVEYPSTSSRQGAIVGYEYNSLGLLSAIVDSYNNRFGIQYFEDLEDVNQNLMPRIKVSRLIDPQGNIVSYHYDNPKNKITVRFERNGSIASEIEYKYIEDRDTGQRYLTQENILITKGYSGIQPVRRSLYYTSDNHFNLEGIEDALGHRTSYQYNEYNQTTKITDALGHNRIYFYDVQKKPDALNPNCYDLIQSEIENIDSDGNNFVIISEYTYKKHDAITSHHSEDLMQSTHRLETFTDSRRNIWRYGYDDINNYNCIKETSFQTPVSYASGAMLKSAYNIYGYKTMTKDPYGRVTKYKYDNHGSLIKISDPNNHSTYWHYDLGTGRLEYTTDARGDRPEDPLHTTNYKYDRNKQLIREIDATRTKRDYEYYPNGWLKAITLFDASGLKTTSFDYDAIGNLINVRDAKGNQTYFMYDEANRLTDIRRGPMGLAAVKYMYDIAGRLTRMVDRNGQTTIFMYDALNRVIDVQEPSWPASKPKYSGKHLTFSYDYEGNRLLMSDDQLGTTPLRYKYDIVGNLIERSDYDSYTIFFEHDANNRLIRVYDSSHYVDQQFKYDLLDRIVTLTDSNYLDPSLEFLYQYVDGRRVNNLYHFRCPAIGLKVDAKYNENDAVTSLQNKLVRVVSRTPITLSEFRYTYNNNNLLLRSAGYHSARYKYDQIKRLEYESEVRLYNGYDPAGNMVWRNNSQNPPATRRWNKFDDQNRLLAKPASRTKYTYDSNGNMLSRKNGNRLEIQCTFDGADRLREIVKGKIKVQYLYDADGLLVQRKYNRDSISTIQKFRYIGGHIIMETDGNSNLKALYTRDTSGRILRRRTPETVERSGQYRHSAFYMLDPHRNIVQVITHDGNVKGRFDYDAWGNRLLNSNRIRNSFGYGEYFTDSVTNFINIANRWYDPNIQRWITEDHFYGYIEDPMSLNLYLYVGNDPINYTDRKGTEREPHTSDSHTTQKQETQKANPNITDVALWILKGPPGTLEKLGLVGFANVFGQAGALVTEVMISPIRLSGYDLKELQGWGSTFVLIQTGLFNPVYRHILGIPPKVSKDQSQPSTDSRQSIKDFKQK